jgi:hypothetical protein
VSNDETQNQGLRNQQYVILPYNAAQEHQKRRDSENGE